jgi:hypothetical protein
MRDCSLDIGGEYGARQIAKSGALLAGRLEAFGLGPRYRAVVVH